MKLLTVLLVFSAVLAEVFNETIYYWRDFNGTILHDALPVGEEKGEKYYVAQGVANNNHLYGLLPAKIKRFQNIIYPCIGKRVAVFDEIKILCTVTPKRFRWLKTSRITFTEDLAGKRPVPGGIESRIESSYRSVLYIGRYEDIIGKIVAQNRYMYYTSKAGTDETTSYYEVLVY